MSILPRFDPLPGFNFLITLIDDSSTFSAIASGIGGLVLGGFTECSGLESTLETFDYLEGGVNDQVLRFPTRMSYSNITLKRGVGLGETLWLWHQDFIEGKGKRRDGFIILQNEMRIPIKIWSFLRGIPVKWTGPSLNAQASAVSIEALEIAHEQLKLVMSPGAALDAAIDAVF
jgi:phage tail-like protein